MEVECIVGPTNLERFAWRVHVMQKVFAPADASTRALMGEYQPDLFGSPSERTQANVALGAMGGSP